MRSLSTLAALLLLGAGTAQSQDLEQLLKQAQQQQGGGQVTIEENTDPFKPLDFTGTCLMEVRSYRNGTEDKDSPAIVRMAFQPDRMAMIASSANTKAKEEMRMVFDLKNRHTFTLITDEKGKRSGMKMKMMKVNVNGASGADETTVERTTETRTILGHTCRKYTYKDSDGHGEAWVAEDLKFDLYAAFRQMVGGKKADGWQKLPHEGMVMENTWHSANGKEKAVSTIRELETGKADAAFFSTEGYDVQDMTAFPVFGK